MFGAEWNLSTRDKLGMGHLSLTLLSLSTRDKLGMSPLSLTQWSLSTRDKLVMDLLSLIQWSTPCLPTHTYTCTRIMSCILQLLSMYATQLVNAHTSWAVRNCITTLSFPELMVVIASCLPHWVECVGCTEFLQHNNDTTIK